MFNYLVKRSDDTPVDPLIDDILKRMSEIEPNSEEYAQLMGALERLHKLKAENRPERVSSDTKALVLGNLLGILLIIAYEQKHAMTSKAFTQVIRPKTTTTQ